MNVIDAREALQQLVEDTNKDSNTYVDLEYPHMEADSILCELIEEYVPNGKELTKLFKEIDKWYA